MNFDTGVHDWLGGYPYEAATADELHDRICTLGFVEERSFRIPTSLGLFGSGCHEFVFTANILDDERRARAAIAVHGRGWRGQQRTAGLLARGVRGRLAAGWVSRNGT